MDVRQKLLFFCNEDKATSWQRSEAFKNLGYEITILYHTQLNIKTSLFKRIVKGIFHRIGIPFEQSNENEKLLSALDKKPFEILFIEKCLTLKPKTLKKLKVKFPALKLICYSLDDFNGKGNISNYFNHCIPMYDLIATNKEHNVGEYYNLKAKKVYYFKNAYSRQVHKPVQVSDEDREKFGADVTFIGNHEKVRAEYLMYLAQNNIKIKVWGWNKASSFSGINHPNIYNMNRHLYFEEYSKAICSSKINLNFLRTANRDTETTRSIEIPACGGFMMAQFSTQHLELFKENEEAVFFNNKEELLQKVKFYLTNENERIKISLLGYNRCIKSDYSYEKQIDNIIAQLPN